jgi:ribulose-phosphate 3-epimerase
MNVLNTSGIRIGASLTCADLAELGDELQRLEQAGIDYLHYDVIDGRFNDTFMLGVPTLKSIRGRTSLPIEVHLAVYKPERYLRQFVDAGADYISVHPEGNDCIEQVVRQIADAGAGPVLALRAETGAGGFPVDILEQVHWVVKLTVNPGYSGQKIQPGALHHLEELHGLIRSRGLETPVAADGNIHPGTIPEAVRAGASLLVGGTSGLFRKDLPLKEARGMMLKAAGSVI